MSEDGEVTLVGAPAWHTMSAEDVLREQGVDAEQGLAAAEVTARRTRFGSNRLMTEFGLFRRILDTTNLDLDQWVICIIVGLLIIPVSEIRKLIVKTPLDEVPSDVAPGAAAVAV